MSHPASSSAVFVSAHAGPPEVESPWGWYEADQALQQGLDVTEHQMPAELWELVFAAATMPVTRS